MKIKSIEIKPRVYIHLKTLFCLILVNLILPNIASKLYPQIPVPPAPEMVCDPKCPPSRPAPRPRRNPVYAEPESRSKTLPNPYPVPNWVTTARAISSNGAGMRIYGPRIKGTPNFYYKGRRVQIRGSAYPRVDRITTGSSDTVELIVSGGHKIVIGPNSSVKLDEVSQTIQGNPWLKHFVDVSKGAIRYSKDILGRSRGPFTVITPRIAVGVKGTSFEIRALANGGESMTLFDGSVDLFDNRANRLVAIRPGQTRFFSAIKPIPAVGLEYRYIKVALSRGAPAIPGRLPTFRIHKSATRNVPIYVNAVFTNLLYLQRSQRVTVRWIVYHKGKRFADSATSFTVTTNLKYVVFSEGIVMRKGGASPSGNYTVECYLNGRLVGRSSYVIYK